MCSLSIIQFVLDSRNPKWNSFEPVQDNAQYSLQVSTKTCSNSYHSFCLPCFKPIEAQLTPCQFPHYPLKHCYRFSLMKGSFITLFCCSLWRLRTESSIYLINFTLAKLPLCPSSLLSSQRKGILSLSRRGGWTAFFVSQEIIHIWDAEQ